MKGGWITAIIIVLLTGTCTALTEITSLEMFDSIYKQQGDFFVVFVDEEGSSTDVIEFWSEVAEFLAQEHKLGGKEYGVYKVDVDRVIDLQRIFRVDNRGQVIFFQQGVEAVRSNWVNPLLSKRWLFSLLDPQAVLMQLQAEELHQQVDNDTTLLLFLPSSPPSPHTDLLRQVGLFNENRALNFFELLPSSSSSFFLSYPPPAEYSPAHHSLFFLLLPSHHHTFLLFASEEGGEGSVGESVGWPLSGSLGEEVGKMGQWLRTTRMQWVHSIAEASHEKFKEFSGLYDYVVFLPYEPHRRDEMMELLLQVEQKPINSHFSFLLIPSSSSRLPHPMCLLVGRAVSGERRIMWDPSLPLTLSSFDEWISSIRSGTAELFTSVDLPPSPTDRVQVEPPVKAVGFREMKELGETLNTLFLLVFFHAHDDHSAKLYPIFHAASLDPSLSSVRFFAYNVATNYYAGPPVPSVLLRKGSLEIPITPSSSLESFLRQVHSEMRRIEHMDEL